MKFDPSKPCALSDGTPARIIARDLRGGPPIAAVIEHKHQPDEVRQFYPDGSPWNDDGEHLVNIETATLSVWRNGLGYLEVRNYAPDRSHDAVSVGNLTLTIIDGKLTAEVKQ
jgi:hypothetical protein